MEMANVNTIMFIRQDDDNTDHEISNDESEYLAEFTLLSDMEKDDLVHWQQVLHLNQGCHDKLIRTTRVLLPVTRSGTNAVIERTTLSTL